jgi:hypothetical protein
LTLNDPFGVKMGSLTRPSVRFEAKGKRIEAAKLGSWEAMEFGIGNSVFLSCRSIGSTIRKPYGPRHTPWRESRKAPVKSAELHFYETPVK